MDDIEALERRVSALEQEVEGEKIVSRYILEQARRNGDDLAALRSRMGRFEGRMDSIEGRLERLEQRVARLESEIRGLRTDLPGIVGQAVREALHDIGR